MGSRQISLCDIDFTGVHPLVTHSTLSDTKITCGPDVPDHVKDCVNIITCLAKYPVYHLKAFFTSDNYGKYFVLQDVCKKLSSPKYKCTLHAKEEEADADTKVKLAKIKATLNDPEQMKLIILGRAAGGSVVKMILRDPSYLEKYVDTINRKPRIIHSTIGTVKKVGTGILGFAFVSAAIVFGPTVVLPYLAYAL